MAFSYRQTAVLLLVSIVGWCCTSAVLQGQSSSIPGEFPAIYNSESALEQPLTPQQALASLHLPPGFTATLFAAEPDVQNPIAAHIDAVGRVWVAENYTYAERPQRFDLKLRDRVVVLEDADGDGVSDKRTVFTDNVQMLTSVVVGQGGVWLMCPPQLLFIPDADGDLVPDGPAQVQLDGFHVARENYHNFANGLSWGPDSWLYGRCGTSCPGELGLPGTTDEQRIPLRGGIWRFHPQRRVVEVLNQGPMNSWGHDWNELGELFFINTVNGHLWHSICGAHYVRPHSIDANPHSYQQIDMHADHWHFDSGASWSDSRDGAANDYGGGHAHIGMMIYQEPTWPAEFHNRLMTINMHGRRVNVERLDPQGSGYVGRHEPDILLSDDPWFRGMELLPMPDGNVLMLDWSDTGECHEATGVHRTSGRIFKVAFGATGSQPPERLNPFLSAEVRQNPAALAEILCDGSEWQARRARELLRSMSVKRRVRPGLEVDNDNFAQEKQWQKAEWILQGVLADGGTAPRRLHGLWGLWAMDSLTPEVCVRLLDDPLTAVRSWAVRRLSDAWPLDTTTGQRPAASLSHAPSSDPSFKPLVYNDAPDAALLDRLVAMAGSDLLPPEPYEADVAEGAKESAKESAKGRLDSESRATMGLQSEPAAALRLTLASTLQRLPLQQRSALAAALMQHVEDAQDHNLPLLVWYGLMPLGANRELTDLAAQSQWPITRQLIVRRLSEEIGEAAELLEQLIDQAVRSGDLALASDIVLGAAKALAGRRKIDMPQGWSALQTLLENFRDFGDNQELQLAVSSLNVLFGDGVAIEELRRVATDKQGDLEQRLVALQSLVDSRADGLRELCLELLSQRYLNVVAARGLAAETDAAIGIRIISAYRAFAPLDRPSVISILCSRKSWGMQLLAAVAAQQIDRSEITPFQARQLSSFQDATLDAMLAEHWGIARDSDAQRAEQMRSLRSLLTQQQLSPANPRAGRQVFDRVCASCHTLYGQGGKLAPDLTGSQRSNLDYLLENIVDPSAVVNKDFCATVVMLEDGRVLTGLVTERNEQVVTLATQEQTLHIASEDISQLKQSAISTMPDGLLSSLTPEQLVDLFAYLQSFQQWEPEPQ